MHKRTPVKSLCIWNKALFETPALRKDCSEWAEWGSEGVHAWLRVSLEGLSHNNTYFYLAMFLNLSVLSISRVIKMSPLQSFPWHFHSLSIFAEFWMRHPCQTKLRVKRTCSISVRKTERQGAEETAEKLSRYCSLNKATGGPSPRVDHLWSTCLRNSVGKYNTCFIASIKKHRHLSADYVNSANWYNSLSITIT